MVAGRKRDFVLRAESRKANTRLEAWCFRETLPISSVGSASSFEEAGFVAFVEFVGVVEGAAWISVIRRQDTFLFDWR